MDNSILLILLLLALSVFVYFIYCANDEPFYIPPNMVTGGDFHIQPVGAIADQGSFANDMDDYMEGQGPI